MGQYHYLVNLDKKEIIHPHHIGNGLKLYEQIRWKYATATVLVMLLASSSKGGGRGGGDFRTLHPLIGSWAGDRIAFIGDYAQVDDIAGMNAKRIYEQSTAQWSSDFPEDKPRGWDTWRDISSQVREMMSAEFGIEYRGEGWLDVIEKEGVKSTGQLAPDLLVQVQPKSRSTARYPPTKKPKGV